MKRLFAAVVLMLSAMSATAGSIQYCTIATGVTPTCITINYTDIVCPVPPPCITCNLPNVCMLPPPVIVPPPPLPSNTATLAWDVMPNATGYRIYTGTMSGVYQPIGTGVLVTAPPYTTPVLTAGTRYYFAATAIYSAGESGFSNEVFKDIPAAAPPGPVESPNLTHVIAAGVGSIIDAHLDVWTLGPKDPTVEGGIEFIVLRNGSRNFPPPQPVAAAQFICYTNHTVTLFSTGSWYQWNGTFFQNIWPVIPAGC